VADTALIRSHFPALERPAIFFDNPGGTQIARQSLDAISAYLVECNANHGGEFATSRQSDARVDAARAAMADFLNAERPEEIVFGANMTTLTYSISRALARTFNPGEALVLTHLDHDANISPWLQVAEDRGMRVLWVDFHPEDCTLDLESLKRALAEKPRLVAFGYASNAVGTINPVTEITRLAHEAGALVYIDAVQYAPHGPIDVQALGCDFLVCSAYKFFGPHLGALYGRYELLESLRAYRVRPAPALPAGKFETGTGNFEHICGLHGALQHFEWFGETFGAPYAADLRLRFSGRRLLYQQAMTALQMHETELSQALITALGSVPGLKPYGIMDPLRVWERVPTFSFTLAGKTPQAVASALGDAGIYVWNGNFYALEVTTTLGLEPSGGLVRVGATHYNTNEEVHRLKEALLSL
jgi:cysteine desulfurase family protein (TIGR01976 family)